MSSFVYHTTILEQYLDNFGHVNHASYFVLFEQARWDFITKRGYGLKEVKERQIGPVILAANIKYRKELRNRDQITIRSHFLSPAPSLIMQLEQKMFKTIKDKEVVASECIFDVGLFDMVKRKLIMPTPEWLQGSGLN
jgi:YbgC/YbaW family acyl-CoA thioester hydrolase